jgi:trigger factor
MNPKIHVDKLDEGEDWKFTAITTEAPAVTLGEYKAKVKEVTAKSKIAIPGKEPQEPSFDEIMQALVETITIQIPEVLIEQEVDRLLAQLLDDVKKLGLTLDQYLGSTKRNPEELRQEYAKRAEQDIKMELILQKIAEAEHITVEDKEVEEAIEKSKDPAEKKQLEGNKYLLASILRQQKTLDFLKNL